MLNRHDVVKMRENMMAILSSLLKSNYEQWLKFMGFPEPAELPNLKLKEPPNGNSRPDGLEES